MESSYRIIETPKGWVVEVNLKKWTIFGLRDRWVPCITYLGIDDAGFPFVSKEAAIARLKAVMPIAEIPME